MSADDISFSLAKNVEKLRKKLNVTEQSISNLEHFAQRKYSSDERSVASSDHPDETSSLPPPLTMEELMEVSSRRTSVGSEHDCISEHTLMSNSTHTFHLLKPDQSYQTIQLTSSPRKASPHSYELFESKLDGSKIANRPQSKDFHGSKKLHHIVSSRRNPNGNCPSSLSETLPQKSCFPSMGVTPNDTFSSQLLDNSYATNSSNGLSPNASPQRPISARSNATSVTLTASDREYDHLKQKLVLVRTENSRLRTVVTQLREQLGQYSNMADLSSASNNEEQLAEKILGLLDQIKANERTLRTNEDELEYKDKLAADKDKTIFALRQKVDSLQRSLSDTLDQKISAESAQKEAAHEVVTLTHKLKETYLSLTARLQESQDNSQKEVAKIMNERNNMIKKLEAVKIENETKTEKLRDVQRKLRLVESESRQQDEDSATMMDQAQQRIRELVAELDEKRNSWKKSTADLNAANQKKRDLLLQCNELKDQNKLFSERLEICQKENEDGKSEIQNLKKSLVQLQRIRDETMDQSSLHPSSTDTNLSIPVKISPRKHHSIVSELNLQIATKEAHIKRLEVRLANQASDTEKYEVMAEELLAISEKARASGRRANELEDVVHLMENERTKYLKKVNDLEDEVHDKTAECESLEKRLKERTTLLNQCQRQVEDLNSKLTSREAELKQKKDEMSNLNNEISQSAADEELMKTKLSEIQAELLEKTRSLESAAERSGKLEAQNRREMKKIKKLHSEQCEELEEQIEFLRKECNKYKSESNLANEQVRLMSEQLVAGSHRIQQLEAEVKLVRKDDQCRTQTHEEALKILEEKLSASTSTIHTLEGTLGQCKDELTKYIDKLHEAQSNFQHQLAIKTDQVSKLETDVKLAQTSLENECSRTMELESAVESRHRMLEAAAARIADLEESQAGLQSQVAKQEQQRSNESSKANLLVIEMERKLELACRELEAKKQQYSELNGALKKVDEDFRGCKKELLSVEAQVEELQREREVRVRDMERVKYEHKEMKSDLDSKIELVAELKADNQRLNRDGKKSREKILDLETELTQLRAQHEDAQHHNRELEAYSQHRNADVINKDRTIEQLQASLKTAETECEQAKSTSKELEKSLEERQWQLQQRAAQLSELDKRVKDFRQSVEKRNCELENELERSQKQLQERNVQVSHLDDQMSSMRSDVAEVRRLLAEEELHIKRLERELMQKDGRIEELNNTVESERKSREERHKACIETSQELRVAREREQKITMDYQDCQRELSRYRREQQQLLTDIHDMGDTIREKDDRLDRLTKQLSNVMAEKNSVESKFLDEFDKAQLDVVRIKQQFEDENENLVSVNAQLRAQLKIATGDQSQELASAIQREQDALEELKQTKDSILTLERELLARKQVIDAGNDTIIVKDAEIARLQAKLSGMERVNIMTSLPTSPVKISVASDKENRPISIPMNNNDIIDKPTWAMNDVTPTSLITAADSEIASLAPSFLPIAASTKRPPAPPTREDSSFFLTSSPTPDHPLHSASTDEDSLCKRVFGEASQHSNYDYSSSDSLSQVVIGKKRREAADRMRPDKCMVELQEKLRASEQRRREVATKLKNLKAIPR